MTPRQIIPSVLSVLAVSAVLGGLLPVSAAYSDPYSGSSIAQAIHEATSKKIDSERSLLTEFREEMSRNFVKVQQTLVEIDAKAEASGRRANPIGQVTELFMALPLSNATVDQITQDVMFNRQREINRIKLDDRADYIVDTSLAASVDAQAFDIFMRYFCDPRARGGTMADFKTDRIGVAFGNSVLNYRLGCGYTDNTNIPSRRTILGDKADASHEAFQIIGLPVRPDALFFEPTTFPTNPESGGASATNVNPLAHIYYAAFSQALLFLLGEPPQPPFGENETAGSTTNYITNQGAVAKHMMASYPFAIMFAERMGTMGPDAARATADLLRDKLATATEDENILRTIADIQNRNTISQAQYMEVLMYQLPLSPGYYSRINAELSPVELRREQVWLTAMQTALNYQRNRWLEMLAALEAVR